MSHSPVAPAANPHGKQDPGRKPDALTTLAAAMVLPLNTAVEASPGTSTVALVVLAVAICAVCTTWNRRSGRGPLA